MAPSLLSCGIDFGTSNCLAAVAGPSGLRICGVDPANWDPQILPSLLYFSRRGWNRVGRRATQAYQDDPDGRFIRSLKSALPEYSPDDRFAIFRQGYNLPDLVRLLFVQIRERLEAEFEQPVVHATIGRPVSWSAEPEVDSRTEEMLRTAAGSAGFRSLSFLSEPEAATRYFYSGERAGGPAARTVLVFDFGGGTLDLCLARFEPGGYEVLARGGAQIGGTLLDRILFERKLLRHLGQGQKWGPGLELPYSIFNRLINPDANWQVSETDYRLAVRQLLNASTATGNASVELRRFHTVVARRLGPEIFSAIEAAKVRLSDQAQTEIRLETPEVRIVEPLEREELRDIFREQLSDIRTLVLETLASAGASPEDVDQVLLAGGSSALICTQELLRDLFGQERVPLGQDLFTSIVRGLALHAAETGGRR